MEDKNSNQNQNGSGNGFLLGALMGSVATLLFTTKKGREIVRDLTEKGIEKIAELEGAIKEREQVKEIEESDYVEPKERSPIEPEVEKVKLAKEETKTTKSETKKVPVASSPKTPREVKRFFRLKKN